MTMLSKSGSRKSEGASFPANIVLRGIRGRCRLIDAINRLKIPRPALDARPRGRCVCVWWCVCVVVVVVVEGEGLVCVCVFG